MKKISFLFLTLLGISLAFLGCNKEKPPTTPIDEENPTITMTSPIEVPIGQYDAYNTNDSVLMDIRFDDDVALDRYEITIRYARDLYYLKTENFPWQETWFGDLEGLSGAFNESVFVVFDPSAGPYEFRVKVWDKVGNMTEKVTYFFVTNLNDTQKPVVNITIPSNNVDTFSIGSVLNMRVQMTDPGQVAAAFVRLRNPITKQLLPGSEIKLDSIWIPNYILDTFVNVQAGSTPGDYLIEAYANDQVYNVGTDTVRVFIRP